MARPASKQKRPAPPTAKRRRWLMPLLLFLGLGVMLLIAALTREKRGGRVAELESPEAPAARGGSTPMRPAPVAPPPATGAPAPAASGSARRDPWGADDSMYSSHLPSAAYPYPPGSQPLTEGTNPAKQDKEEMPLDPREGITVIFGPRIAVVHPPDPMVIDLEVRNRLGARLPVTNAVARFRADRTDPKTGPWFTATFVDDGSGADLAAGDSAFTATYLPADDAKTAFSKGGSHVYVEVTFECPAAVANPGPHTFPTTMTYSREPDASLNGKYTDDVENGSLVVNAGVTAKQAGSYRVIASLYGNDGQQAIAFASQTAQLGVGDGSIPLLFFGKILYDRGIDGPYQVRYAMLFEELPGLDVIPGDTVDPAYTTKAYRARDFAAASYVEPAPSFPVVDMNSPSQQNKPPPLFGPNDRMTRHP